MVAQVEVPDGYRVVTLVGVETDGTPQVVQLDGTGRIVAVIQGEIEGITGPVDVAQTNSQREIQGADGATLRTVALDANGQLIMVPRGQSGNYMTVDASGFLTAVMKGEYSGSPVTLAVDGDGNIVAVMKGEYSGILKTIATDADGRVVMIPTDPADVWGNAIGTGNAELAAVLSPAKRYDRRGQVLFIDSFEDGLGVWATYALGTDSVVNLSSLQRLTGAYGVYLASSADPTNITYIKKNLAYPHQVSIGLSIMFSPRLHVKYFTLIMQLYDTTYVHIAQLRANQSSGALQYYDSAGAWQTVADVLIPYIPDGPFSYMKLVADFGAGEYVRAIVNDTEYDLSGIAYRQAASAVGPFLTITASVESDQAALAECWVDDVILTQNEPA